MKRVLRRRRGSIWPPRFYKNAGGHFHVRRVDLLRVSATN